MMDLLVFPLEILLVFHLRQHVAPRFAVQRLPNLPKTALIDGIDANRQLRPRFGAPQDVGKRGRLLERPGARRLHGASHLRFWVHGSGFQVFDSLLRPLRLLLEGAPGGLIQRTDPAAEFHEPEIRVVVAEQEPVLGPAGEHPVGLGRSLGDEIVYQNADIGLLTAQNDGFLAAKVAGGVDPRHDPLGGGLLIPGRPVDLAGVEEARHLLRHQASVEFGRLHVVILDGVAGAHHLGSLQAFDCP